MIQFRPALSSKANDSDEYYGDDDDGDGGHDPHPHSPQVPCSRVPNENHSNTCSSVHESEPNRNSAWSDKRPIQFSQEHHKPSTIFQLNKAMNMRCRSPEQHRRKGTTNSHTGNSTSTSLCTTSSPSLSSVCRRGGEGEGALWFPVLWVILPHPAPVVPGLVVPCAPAPPRWPRREA